MYKNCNRMIVVISFLVFSSCGWAGLSATTANTIKGTGPILVPGTGMTSLVANSSFKVNGTTYKESDNTYNTSILFDNNLKLNDFTIIGLLPSHFNPSYFYDSDGDTPNAVALDEGTLSYRWIDNNSKVVLSADYNKTLLQISASYSFPLTLEITNSGVKVRSQYGDPDESQGATLTKNYLINYEAGIYVVKPGSTGKSCQWIEKLPGVNSDPEGWVCASQATPGQSGHKDINGGGYSADYLPDLGFKPVPIGNKFPTVGFPGAEFQLVMIGNQSDYIFSLDSGTGVSVGASDGIVKLNSQPSNVKIKAHHNSSAVDYFYEFTITKWLKPQNGNYDYNSAVTLCGASNMISRSDFTNSPIVSVTGNWSYIRNYGTRAIDGTLYGEWGHMSNTTYSNSDWQNNRYWTKDVNYDYSPSVNKNFFVHSFDGGYIGDEWANNSSLGVVCK